MLLIWGRIIKISCSLGHNPGRNNRMTQRPQTHKSGSKVKINTLWLASYKEHDILTLYFSRWIVNKLKSLAYFDGIASVWVSLPVCCTISLPAWEEEGEKNSMSFSIKRCVHSWEWRLACLSRMAIGHPFNLVWVTDVTEKNWEKKTDSVFNVSANDADRALRLDCFLCLFLFTPQLSWSLATYRPEDCYSPCSFDQNWLTVNT